MIKVLFFAQLREKLNCSKWDHSINPAFKTSFTVADLKSALATKGDAWQAVFTDPQVLVAVNQVMCNNNTLLASGDEVAFFPPVTGG